MKIRLSIIALLVLLSVPAFAGGDDAPYSGSNSGGPVAGGVLGADGEVQSAGLGIQADEFTGAAIRAVPLPLPPGRGGLTPRLILSYNSLRRNPTSWVGLGWDLSLGEIVRAPQQGNVNYYDGTAFDVRFLGQTERLSLVTAGVSALNYGVTPPVGMSVDFYHARVDSSRNIYLHFIKKVGPIGNVDGGWVVIDKDGTQYWFGMTQSSQDYSPSPGLNQTWTSRWLLEKIVDTNGNVVEVTYGIDKMPDSILYGDIQVVFSKLGIDYVRYFPTFREGFFNFMQVARLDKIIVKYASSGQRLLAYGFEYQDSSTNQAPLLKVVKRFGATDAVALPPITFGYYGNNSSSFSSAPTIISASANTGDSDPANFNPGYLSTMASIMDLDGNGLQDLVLGLPNKTFVVRSVTGKSADVTISDPIADSCYKDFCKGLVSGVKTFAGGYAEWVFVQDMNGDSIPDRVLRKVVNNASSHFLIAFGTPGKMGWAVNLVTWNDPANTYDPGINDYSTGLIDLNGDGLPDRIVGDAANKGFNVYWNTGNGFNMKPEFWKDPLSVATPNHPAVGKLEAYDEGRLYVDVRDVTGDGLPDRVYRTQLFVDDGSGNLKPEFGLHISVNKNGHGWAQPVPVPVNKCPSGTACTYFNSSDTLGIRDPQTNGANRGYISGETFDLIDYNLDGYADRVEGVPSTGKIRITYYTGLAPLPLGANDPTNNIVQFDPNGTLELNDPVSDSGEAWPVRGYIKRSFTSVDNGPAYQVVAIRDVDGDGYPDRVTYTPRSAAGNAFKRQMMTYSFKTETVKFSVTALWADPDINQPSNALRLIDDGQGKVTATEYVPSTDFYAAKNRFMPSTMYLVHKLYSSDREAPQDNSPEGKRYPGMRWATYFYNGGNTYVRYASNTQSYEARFNGFQSVRKEFSPMAGETWSSYAVTTWFHQSKGDITDKLPGDQYVEDQGYTNIALAGRPYKREMREAGTVRHREIKKWALDAVVKTASNPDCGMGACRPLLTDTQSDIYEVFANSPRTQTGNYQFDGEGNVTTATIRENGKIIKVANSTYYPSSTFSSAQIRNRLNTKTITDGNKTYRKQSFIYDSAGNVETTQNYADASKSLTSTRNYGKYGNVKDWTGTDGVKHGVTYDADGVFPVTESITLPGGQVMTTSRSYHRQSGKLSQELDPHGVGKSVAFDAFGRPVSESTVATDGTQTLLHQWNYAYLNLAPGAVYEVLLKTQMWEVQPGYQKPQPDQITYTDGNGRVRQSCTLSETGIYRLAQYATEEGGRVRKQTVPKFSGDCNLIGGKLQGGMTVESLDIFGRVGQVLPPAGDVGSPTSAISINYKTDSYLTLQRELILPGGNKKTERVNSLGQVVAVDEGTSGAQATYKYSPVGDLLSVSISGKQQMSTQVDWLGRKTQTNDSDLGQWSYYYDALGRLQTQTDAKGQKTVFDYDAVGRIKQKKYTGKSGIEKIEAYAYDTGAQGFDVLAGELASVQETAADGSVLRNSFFSYDSSYRRMAKMEREIPGIEKFDQSFVHNFKGQMTSTQYPGGKTITQTYNMAGGILQICGAGGCGQENYYTLDPATSFDAYGALLKETFGNGVVTENSYYPGSHRLKARTTSRSGKVYSQRDYQHTIMSNVASITDPLNAVGSGAMTSVSYDAQDRLMGYQPKTGPPVGFTYDPNGNILSKSDTYLGKTYVYGSARPHAVTQIGSDIFNYDANGNMVQDPYRTMTYSAANQLTQIKMVNGGTVDVDYDFTGARVLKKSAMKDVNGKNWQVVTHYLGEVMEVRIAPVELGADGKPVSPLPPGAVQNGTVLLHISAGGQRIASQTLGSIADVLKPFGGTLWGIPYNQLPPLVAFSLLLAMLIVYFPRVCHPSLREGSLIPFALSLSKGALVALSLIAVLIVAPPLAVAGDTGTPTFPPSDTAYFVFYHSDHLGSAQLITEGKSKGLHAGITYLKGDVIQRFEYAAYGHETFALNPNLSWDPAFTGQQYDVETGLYYYRARYYNPIIGRFTQPDTIVQDALDPQSWNRYAYVRNNPLKYVDPTGHVIEIDLGDKDSNDEDTATATSDGESGGDGGDDLDPDGDGLSADGRIVINLRDSGSGSGGGTTSGDSGGGHSDGSGSVREEGGLVGASVSSVGMAVTTGELSLQSASYNIFGRSVQSVEHALSNGEFAHTNGEVYSRGFRGNQYISSVSVESSLATGRFLRGLGTGLTIIGLGAAAYEFSKSPGHGSDYARLGAEIGITFSAGIPYVGPFISISLGYANSMGIFEPAYHYFDQ